jgi:hypothetical protein
MFSAGSPIIGHSLAVMAGMNYDSFTQWAPAQTIFSTNDKVNSYFSLVNIRSTATMYMQMLYNAPHDIYGSLRHIYLCNKEDHYPVPTNIVYDDYHGTIDDMVKLAQRISNSYNTNGVLAKYLNVKDSLAAPNGGSASSIDAAAYADINLNGAKELQQQLKSAVDQAIEGTHEASSQTVGGTYNHSPAQVISLAGVPIYLMMNVLRKYTSFGYQNALGYQLGYLVDALVKCFTQGIVINEASPGRLHLVTSTFSPLFPYIPTSFPNMTYTADLDNRPNYTIDRAGQVIPDVQPFDVYPYISAEEIQPSAYLVVQDEYADVINALNK